MPEPEFFDDADESWRDRPTVPELSTVGTDEAVVHEGIEVRRHTGLAPGTFQEVEGFRFRTLPDLGPLLARVTTVNDLHFGEHAAGIIRGRHTQPILEADPDHPYPEVMNGGAAAEMAVLAPDLVVAKGDLTAVGAAEQHARFRAVYRDRFGDRLIETRGNHDAGPGSAVARVAFQRREVPGATVVLLDTALEAQSPGTVTNDQLDALDAVAAEAEAADRPVLVFGHHPIGDRDSPDRADRTYGIDPAASDRFRAVVARRPAIALYASGHTHRNRVRRFPDTGDVPWIEVGAVKDYPGNWAEYRIHEGGIAQIVHRVSSPAALAWTEQNRDLYAGTFGAYALGSLADRCFTITPRPRRPAPARRAARAGATDRADGVTRPDGADRATRADQRS